MQKFSLKSYTSKMPPQLVKKVLVTLPMNSIISKLVDPKASKAGAKVDKSTNRYAGIAEVSMGQLMIF